jgi:hypothetical protein
MVCVCVGNKTTVLQDAPTLIFQKTLDIDNVTCTTH